jgi:death-on-curing protein
LRSWPNDSVFKREGFAPPSASGARNRGQDWRSWRGVAGCCTGKQFAGFGDVEFYPTKEEKGARLGYELISNHAFVDGNKRIGMYVLTFLEVNGIRLECSNEDVVRAWGSLRNDGLSHAAGLDSETQSLDVLAKDGAINRDLWR